MKLTSSLNLGFPVYVTIADRGKKATALNDHNARLFWTM